MADDTNGHTTSGTGPADHRPDERIVEAAPVEPSSAAHQPAKAATDWTASDARGPLNEAPSLGHEAGGADTEAAHDEHHRAEPHGEARPASEVETPVSPAMPAPVATVTPRRSLLPVVAGVVVGAIIGAGSAYFVYDLQSGGSGAADQKLAQLSGRVDALEQRPDPQAAIATLKASMADLAGKATATQKAPAAGPQAPAAPPSNVSSSNTSSPNVSSPNASSQKASSPNVATPAAPSAASFDPAALQQKISTLQASLADLQKQADASKGLEGKVGDLQSTVESLKAQGADVKTLQAGLAGATAAIAGVQKQATGAQTGVEAIQGQQKSFEGRISAPALAVVADSLVQQIDQGQPYAQQVDALVTLGADPARIAILRENARKGVPSAKTLATQFAPLAEPILATEHKVAANAGLFDRLKSGMSSMVSIRSTSDTTGNDLGARVSRIEADLTHGDVTGAYTTWAALPADAKAKSDAWGALAKTSAEAIDAARALQQGAIASLGGRKS